MNEQIITVCKKCGKEKQPNIYCYCDECAEKICNVLESVFNGGIE